MSATTEREREQVGEGGVVVLGEIRAARDRKDLLGAIRIGAVIKQFVLEYPLVPHVDRGVAIHREGDGHGRVGEQRAQRATSERT